MKKLHLGAIIDNSDIGEFGGACLRLKVLSVLSNDGMDWVTYTKAKAMFFSTPPGVEQSSCASP